MNDYRVRGFEIAKGWEDKGIDLPRRQTAGSAGYDLAAAESVVIEPGQVTLVSTGVKAFMPVNEVLHLYARSSLGVKRLLLLINSVGIIDSDYYANPDNDGHIMVPYWNLGTQPVEIQKGERVAQGIFQDYWTTDTDNPVAAGRTGGIGSAGK